MVPHLTTSLAGPLAHLVIARLAMLAAAVEVEQLVERDRALGVKAANA